MESFILFYEKCRLCLNQPGVCNMFEREELPQDIYLCTGVKVHPTDNLPQKICSNCSKVITLAKELREIATKNNTHLRSLFEYDESRLVIDEGEDVSSSGPKGDDNMSQEEQDTNVDGEQSSPSKKKLSVRKDLFETSGAVTSSTRSQMDSTERKDKKIKLDNSFSNECDECGKTFDTSKKLYLHQRMHNKSVICPLDACGKKFATKGDLEKHFRTHTGEKPYNCHVCGRGFSQRVTLKAHKEKQHASER